MIRNWRNFYLGPSLSAKTRMPKMKQRQCQNIKNNDLGVAKIRAPKRKSQIQLYYYLKIICFITLTAICSGVTLTFATILPAVEHYILTHATFIWSEHTRLQENEQKECQILQSRLLTITKPMKQYSALSFFSTFLFSAEPQGFGTQGERKRMSWCISDKEQVKLYEPLVGLMWCVYW